MLLRGEEILCFLICVSSLYVLWWRCRREKSSTGGIESVSRLHGVHDREEDTSWRPSWNWFKWSKAVSRVCKVRWLFVQFGSHIEIPWQTAAFVQNQNGGLHHGGRSFDAKWKFRILHFNLIVRFVWTSKSMKLVLKNFSVCIRHLFLRSTFKIEYRGFWQTKGFAFRHEIIIENQVAWIVL